MTDKKITELTALTGANVAVGDEFVLVDISDTTMAATGTDKNITSAEVRLWLATTVGVVAIDKIFTAKGDIAIGTAANASAKLAAGTNTYGLEADSTQSTGVKWSTVFSRPQEFNAQTGTTYTLVAGDVGKIVTLSNAAAITLTLPQDSDATIAIGSSGNLYALGAGQFTVVAGTGATLRLSGLTAKSRAQYAMIGWLKIAANTFALFGDLAAS